MPNVTVSESLTSVLDKLPPRLSPLASKYRDAIAQSSNVLEACKHGADTHGFSDGENGGYQVASVLFPGRALIADTDGYDQAKQRNWSRTCWLQAGCILKLRNTVEVALAMKLVSCFPTTFAIRSGGHMANPGFSSVDQSGVLFDLGEMNNITISESHDICTVGSGATWDEVYEELEKYDRTVVGGRVKGVGVGGLLLGGGMSHFSNHWGMACDNLKSFEIVLADARVVLASSTENQDLFWALKGGGPNFGILTQVEMYTFRDYKIWYNLKAFSVTEVERVAEATVIVQKAMEVDDRIGFFLSISPDSLAAGCLYRGDAPDGSVFAAFDGIPTVAEPIPATTGTQGSLCNMLAMPGPTNFHPGGIVTQLDAPLYVQLHRVIRDLSDGLPSSVSSYFSIQPIGVPAVKIGQEKGGNCMNIPPQPQSWIAIGTSWTENDHAELARTTHDRLINSMESTASERSLLLGFLFMNDSRDSQSPLRGYGAANLKRLSEVSWKWDPDGVFQKRQNGGFLISKAMQSNGN